MVLSRRFLIPAAVCALLMAGQAQARPPEALACALQAAPAGLDARVAEVIVSRDDERGKPALDEVRALTDACAEDQFLTPRQRDAYYIYVIGRMGRDVLDARLAAVGLPSAVIDRALDIGPGNANNPAAKVTQGGWGLITAWIIATANMFDGLRDLD